jgi:hypothetical protein
MTQNYRKMKDELGDIESKDSYAHISELLSSNN